MHKLAEIFANINPIKYWNKIRRLIYFLAICYGIWGQNPLPSDEETIENFKAHRSDFEEVVRRYRTYQFTNERDGANWHRDGDSTEMMNRAGIHYISENIGI